MKMHTIIHVVADYGKRPLQQIIKEMNISKIESLWSRDLEEYMEERYGIDMDEIICEAIRECEDAELHQIQESSFEQVNTGE